MNVERVEDVPRLPSRDPQTHKGTVGRVLVVGGSAGMIGAPAMAANAALRGGTGLAAMALPASVQPYVATLAPCATSTPLPCDADGRLATKAVHEVLRQAERNDVLAVGPGLGVGTAQRMLVQAVLERDQPVVLDADGLNNLAQMLGWPGIRRCPLVLTPHPGEMARLTGRSIKAIQADRENVAAAAVREWADSKTAESAPLVLVLKGAGSVVTDGRRAFVNPSGNPGMATGGAGDVLTGVIAALLGQKLSPFDAAVLGTYIHGAAGDLAAETLGQVSMMATDITDHLGRAFQRHQAGD